jgi:hypothetical protein
MYGYIVPDEAEDPDKYNLCLLSLFTPYADPVAMMEYEVDGEIKHHSTYKAAFDGYMENISYSDPIYHKWIQSLAGNMRSIKEGRNQQKLDRQERERLQQEQELMPSEPLPAYDHSIDEDDESALGPSDMEALIRRLPANGTGPVPKSTQNITDLLESQLHPSRATTSQSHLAKS